jgi:hypothetical protein
LLQAIGGKISLIETAIPTDDCKVVRNIRTAGLEKPLKVKSSEAGLEVLVEVHYAARAV